MKQVCMFPGQGSQRVGMGAALAAANPVAQAVFEEVDDALGMALSQLMWEGPVEQLTLTENAQPAIMASSVAAFRAVESVHPEIGQSAFVAGHSLGEYSALCAAKALSLSECARLLQARGQAMQSAVAPGRGAMAAVIGLDRVTVERVLTELEGDGDCAVANDNAPGQVTISGAANAVHQAREACLEAGAKRAIPLEVSAPFHCLLMEPAAREMATRLADVEIQAPAMPVVTNVTARPIDTPEEIRSALVTQVTAMVRWRDSVEWLVTNDVGRFIEFGTGKVLTGLVRRMAPEAELRNIESAEDVDGFA